METIEQKLTELPGKIQAQQIAMLATAALHEDKVKEIQTKKLSVSDFVLNNESAKAKYTNDKARTAAVEVQLALDADYQQLLKDEKVLEQKVQLERIDLECLRDTLRATIAIAGLLEAGVIA